MDIAELKLVGTGLGAGSNLLLDLPKVIFDVAKQLEVDFTTESGLNFQSTLRLALSLAAYSGGHLPACFGRVSIAFHPTRFLLFTVIVDVIKLDIIQSIVTRAAATRITIRGGDRRK